MIYARLKTQKAYLVVSDALLFEILVDKQGIARVPVVKIKLGAG